MPSRVVIYSILPSRSSSPHIFFLSSTDTTIIMIRKAAIIERKFKRKEEEGDKKAIRVTREILERRETLARLAIPVAVEVILFCGI